METPCVFGSCPDVRVTYDNSLESPKRAKDTITSTLNSKNHSHYTSVRAHSSKIDTLIFHFKVSFLSGLFQGEEGDKGTVQVTQGQLRRVLGIFSRPAYTVSHKENMKKHNFPKNCPRKHELALNKLRLESGLHGNNRIQRNRLHLVTQHRPRRNSPAAAHQCVT